MNIKGLNKRLNTIENELMPGRQIHIVICKAGQNPNEIWKKYIKENRIGNNDIIYRMNYAGQEPFPPID